MAQAIRNIKAGQLFEVIGNKSNGFKIGSIVEANGTAMNIKDENDYVGDFNWVGGYGSEYKRYTLCQKTIDLKRYKGKIK